MANNITTENFVFCNKYFPDCFKNDSLIDNLGNLVNDYNGNYEELIKVSFKMDANKKIHSYNGFFDKIYGYKKGSEPIQVTISKPNGGNRIISIPNPLALIPIDQYIKNNIEDILEEQELQSENYYSSSNYSYDPNGFIVGYTYDGDILTEETEELVQKGFDDKEMITHKICSGRYYHMCIDISNFFNSIYSHSLSWDLKNINSKQVFENIDVLSRNLNKNETKGIIIGPYTSGIISEIILSKIDRKIIDKYKNDDISFVRFCDDYDFFSDSKEKLENDVKNYIGEVFAKFGLDLNLSKYRIEEFPFVSLKTLQKERLFILKSRIQKKDIENSLEYIEYIMNELSSSLKQKYYNCNYMLVVLNSMYEKNEISDKYIDVETSKILLDYLINMMFKNDLVSKQCINLIINIFKNLNLSSKEEAEIIEKWINKRNTCSTQLKEIVDIWLQYIILCLNLKSDIITQYICDSLKIGVLQAILAIEYLYKNNLIVEKQSILKKYLNKIESELNNRFGNDWKNAVYDTKYWLLFYTNSQRWKIHDLTEFNNSIFADLFIPNLINSPCAPKHILLMEKILNYDIQFFSI